MTDETRFDTGWVVATACGTDPSLDPALAEELAAQAWDHLVAMGDLDAPELSRRLLSGSEGLDASHANAVATAAVAHCESTGPLP